MDPGDQKERSLDVGQDVEASGIEGLPRRVSRYEKAKKSALDVADYIARQPGAEQLHQRVSTCGDYLLFRHYYTVDEVRLHAASLCMKHLLCPLCACRRGSKALKAYSDRWKVIQPEKPALRPFLVTLTVKDGPDLAERFNHLHKAQRELWKRKQRGRGSYLDVVEGAVWSYEIKRGENSALWHPHLHMIALAPDLASEDHKAGTLGALSREWKEITGDSHMVNVKPITGDHVEGFMEVFKYAVKFNDQSPEDTWHAFQTLKGKRLLASSGVFRGVEVPEQLTDEPLEGLPFVELFYRYLHGAGYSLRDRQAEREAVKPAKGRGLRPVKANQAGAGLGASLDGGGAAEPPPQSLASALGLAWRRSGQPPPS